MIDGRDVYSRITNKIIADLDQGVRPWMQPWSAEHAAGGITRPLRHNGVPYTTPPYAPGSALKRMTAAHPAPKPGRQNSQIHKRQVLRHRNALKSGGKNTGLLAGCPF